MATLPFSRPGDLSSGVPRAVKTLPRYPAARLREALADTPTVLIHGPRQSGKTTPARIVGEPRGYRYVSFDDEATRTLARNDPIGFVNRLPARAILDEVQRVPEIFTSLKIVIDQRRVPGRFILTGSANVFFGRDRSELVTEVAGLICRMLTQQRCSKIIGNPQAGQPAVELRVDDKSNLLVWRGGRERRWDAPVTVIEPARDIADFLHEHGRTPPDA